MKRVSSPFTALRFPDFRNFWIGLFISAIGSQMQLVAITWHVYLLTHSAFSLGAIGLARFLPLMFLSPISGLLADKYDRKKLIFINQFMMAGLAFILAYLTFIGKTTPFVIYAIVALGSITQAIDIPARNAFTPNLVPRKHFIKAVSINTLMWQSSIVIGPTLAGFAIAYLGLGSIYFINAISYLAVVVSVLLIKTQGKAIGTNQAQLSLIAIKEGIHFILKTPVVYASMLLDFVATFFSSSTTLLPIFAKDIFAVGPQGLGFLYAASSIGAVLAGLLFSSYHHIKKQGLILLGAVFVYGAATMFFGMSKTFVLSLIFLAISGAGDVVSTIIRNTIRQLITPDYLRGRMTSINMLFYTGGPQLGEVEAGVVAGFWGAPVSVIIGGLGTIVMTVLIAYLVPKLRNYQGDEILT